MSSSTKEVSNSPQFAGKKLRSVPTISITKDVQRAEVPVDPALALANRFMKLAGS
jgi:alpha-galactosidase